MKYRSLGIAGTAKNTGKTTAMAAVMTGLRNTRPDIRLAVTSIGYDGEYLDNVTGLPKPRVEMRVGDLAAVASECLRFSRARLDILEETDIMTGMGRVLIGRVARAGKLVIAGANKRVELRRLLIRLAALGADLTIVDGALGRIVPLCEVDALILSTGASRRVEIDRLAAETRCMSDILTLPAIAADCSETVGPVLTDDDFAEFLAALSRADTVCVRGLMGGPYMERFAKDAESFRGKRVLFENPMVLLPAAEIEQVHANLTRLHEAGVSVGVLKSVRMLAVTINPYYPRYRFSRQDYEPAYVDKGALYEAIKRSTDIPVYNVFEHGVDGIVERLLEGDG